MSKTILITGGAGYIGSQTNLSLLDAGYKTVVFDNLVYGHEKYIPPQSVFVKGDLSNQEQIDKVFKDYKIDGVIHFAAYAYVGESVENPRKYYLNNVVGTMNLLHAMLDNGVKDIVFSSSCATYGIPEAVPITESEKQMPINPYGYTKLMVEQIFKDYHKAYNLNSISLRYFNACGADLELRTGENHNPETHLIPLVLQVAAGKRYNIKIFGNDYDTPDGTCVRDYIHTKDLAAAHILALEKIFETGNLCKQYNLGTGNGYSVLEIINKAIEVTNHQISYEISPRREGDPAKLVADNTKARTELGWQPQYSDLDTIIKTAWKWEKKLES
jgi:UDP-glucose 4-epimerase